MNIESWLNGEIQSELSYDRVCVAGGAIRDSLFGKDIKDVDVFIGVHESLYAALMQHTAATLVFDTGTSNFLGVLASKHGRDPKFFLDKSTKNYYGKRSDFISYQSEHCPGLNIIVVEVEEGVKNKQWIGALLQTFPASISKVALDLEDGEMIMTEDFIETLKTKKILYPASCPDEYRSRLMNKYHAIEGWSHEILLTVHSVMSSFAPYLRPTAFSCILKT